MSDLKPCPFCGSTDIINRHYGERLRPTYAMLSQIVCKNCGASTDGVDEGTEVAAWNTRADQWQPIETAPKDGTLFLAYEKGEEMAVMEWSRRCNSFRVCADTEWFSCLHPTHWMPLPVPPADHSEDTRDMVKTAENKEK